MKVLLLSSDRQYYRFHFTAYCFSLVFFLTDTFYIGEENKTTETDHIRGTIRSHRGFSQPSDIKIVNSGVRVKDLNQNVTDVMLVKFDFVFNESANEGSTSCNEDKLYVYTEGQTSRAYYNAMKPPTEGWIPHYITGNDFIFQFISHGCSSYRFSFEYIGKLLSSMALALYEGNVSYLQFTTLNYPLITLSDRCVNLVQILVQVSKNLYIVMSSSELRLSQFLNVSYYPTIFLRGCCSVSNDPAINCNNKMNRKKRLLSVNTLYILFS